MAEAETPPQPETLAAQLAAQLQRSRARRSVEVTAIIDKGVQDLIDSGIAEQSLKIGDHAPTFALPDVQGKTVALNDLLASGPVVVAFYRGSW